MKVVILAGGYGTRISEESQYKPKPMIEIGSMPILWHIMKEYFSYGYQEFIICAGYKQYVIKEYFSDYFLHKSNVTYDFTSGKNEMVIHSNSTEAWKVTVVDTGLNTMTGGRLKRIKEFIGEESFLMTYGDGVCDVNIRELVEFHSKGGALATLTAVQPGGRFGSLVINGQSKIRQFAEKRQEDGGWVNGGYMVLEPEVLDYIDGDNTSFEREPLERLAKEGQLEAYKHKGFWQCMDTMRDKELLEALWRSGRAPWKVWKE